MDYGFVRVGAAVPELKVADCNYNASQIIELVKKAYKEKIKIIVFPELSVTSYTCGDLFGQDILLMEAIVELGRILNETAHLNIISIVGLPLCVDNQLFNCGAVLKEGKILGVVPKTHIPNYSEFYEKRWFASGTNCISNTITIFDEEVPFGRDILFCDKGFNGLTFGVEICEDLWVPIPPSSYQSLFGASIIFNLSASNEIIGKHDYRKEIIRLQSSKCIGAYVYTSSNINESTTDLVFGGHATIMEYGSQLAESQRFSFEEQIIFADIDIHKIANDRRKNNSFMNLNNIKDINFRRVFFTLSKDKYEDLKRYISPQPFVPSDITTRDQRCQEIFSIQTSGLAKRMKHAGIKYGVIGVSGGLDSTLALLVITKTFDTLSIPRENIIGVTMPGFGTTDATYNNALEFMKSMGISIREINIKSACLQHFKDIGHDEKIHDVTYENVQARERTQILMDIANKVGGLVIGTGDLSELALGWCTYNADHMSMYSVNCGVPKTLVKYLVDWVAHNVVESNTKDVLKRILDTPISPELLPPDNKGDINQKTEDIVGPYELHDFFLYHMLRYGATPKKIFFMADIVFKDKYSTETIKKWLRVFIKRFFTQQFKRSCLPDGPKVGTISLSPRGDWRMPSDGDMNCWMKELDGI